MRKSAVFFLRIKLITYLLIFGSLITSCSKKRFANQSNYQFKSETDKSDYSNIDHWASHPRKIDAADNTPQSILNSINNTPVDVFFLHPTTYLSFRMPMGWNADIDHKKTNKKTDKTTILFQASVFNQHCRIFAPRYRQANLKAFFIKDSLKANTAFDTAYQDIKNAFTYYLKHYNNRRPIIIASHSQGTLHAARLLKDFFEKKPLQKQLVVAYIVGLPVFENYFTELKPCEDSTQTGCFIGWRTFKEGYIPRFVSKEIKKAYVTNPLTWTLNEIFASSDLNKGGILRDFNTVIPGLVHAQVHQNILWVNKPKFFGNIFLTIKNYHIADYNLFYMNIRENVATRIKYYTTNKN